MTAYLLFLFGLRALTLVSNCAASVICQARAEKLDRLSVAKSSIQSSGSVGSGGPVEECVQKCRKDSPPELNVVKFSRYYFVCSTRVKTKQDMLTKYKRLAQRSSELAAKKTHRDELDSRENQEQTTVFAQDVETVTTRGKLLISSKQQRELKQLHYTHMIFFRVYTYTIFI